MNWIPFFRLLFIFLFSSPLPAFSSVGVKKIMERYTKNSGVKMKFKKNTYLNLLKKTKTSSGKIFLSNGSVFLKVEDVLNTRILFDGTRLWYITSPEGEGKQIIPVKLNKAQGNKPLLSALFHYDLFFRSFSFIGSRLKGRTQIWNFKPKRDDSDIHSFSVKVEGNLVLKIWLQWKNTGNKEEYTFFNIRFNQNIPPKYFKVH